MAKQQEIQEAKKYDDLHIDDFVVISKKQLENVQNEDEGGYKVVEKEVQCVVTKFFWESVEVNENGFAPSVKARLIGVPVFSEKGEMVDVIKF
jgi:hypothetical protein